MSNLSVANQINNIFDAKCVEFASDSVLMDRLRVSRFYSNQISLGRTEFDAICNAVRLSA